MSRLAATQFLVKLLNDEISLASLKTQMNKLPPQERPLVQELCYGVTRWFFRLTFIAEQFLNKPLKEKDKDVYVLLLIGIYQLLFTRIPHHAALSETVNTARLIHKEWATKLINAVLRRFLQNQSTILKKVNKNEEALYAHPQWLIDKCRSDWPNYQEIFEANNQYPPLCLRVNRLKISREDYLALLDNAGIAARPIPWTCEGIQLETPVDIQYLPQFDGGYVSVQDGAAQLAVELLDPQPEELILDACAAPGGKTGHILEREPQLKGLIAIDNHEARLQKVRDNLNRLGLKAEIIFQDVIDLNPWQENKFDRILLDVPCSSSGVIRRHPDIKLRRTSSSIDSVRIVQLNALKSVWRVLKPGGCVLYVTCSIFPEENHLLVKDFMDQELQCQEEKIITDWGIDLPIGKQILPGMVPSMDGFYFAKLRKL